MIKSFLKRLIPAKSKQLLRDKLGVPSQELSFKNIKRLGFAPQRCLDIGAYEGYWHKGLKRFFPIAR
ncbi:MAG: hypothetical protein ABJA76_20425 [Mucilaginibacter sp.]